MDQLEGKVAVVTGVTGGNGQAMVGKFIDEGARVMGVGRSADKLDALAEAIGDGKRFDTFVADATDEEVANMAVFLAGDRSSHSTGSLFTLDGGYTAV